jgi:hypothetical protein
MKCFVYALVAFCLVLPTVVFAQQKNLSVTPTPSWLVPYHPDLNKKPDAREISDGYYLVLSEEQNNAEAQAVYHHTIRQIVSETGIQNGSEISIDYDPNYQKLHFHQIIIRRDGEVINKLQLSSFKVLQQEEDLSEFIYSGVYTAYYMLEDVRKGDEIEYAYTLEGRNPIFDNKYSNYFYLANYTQVMNLYKNLIISPQRDVQFRSFNGAALPTKSDWKGMELYEWKAFSLAPARETHKTPSWYYTQPFVQVSEYKDWKEVADWGVRISTPPPAGALLKARVAELKKESGNDKALYMQKATRFVQDDIRYMGIEMGEYSHRPNTPDKILSQRFGDCKDKALLLATLLNADSIPANIAYLSTYNKEHVEDYLPMPGIFNHAIVYTELKGKPHWIDATINYQRGTANILTIPSYGKALIVRPGTTTFTKVDNGQDGQQTVIESFKLPEDRSKPASLKVTTLYTLQYADDERDGLASESRKDLEKKLTDYYKEDYPSLTGDSILQVRDNELKNELETIEQYTIAQPWERDSTSEDRLIFTTRAGLLDGALPTLEDDDTSHAPLALRYPFTLDYTISLDMPIEWTFSEPDEHIKNPYYQFDFTSSVDGRHVTLHYYVKTLTDNVPAEYLSTYRRDKHRIDNLTTFDLSFSPSGTPITHRSKRPGEEVNWLALGMALLALGFFIYQARLFYRRSLLEVEEPQTPMPLEGWLAMLMVVMVASPLLTFAEVVGNQAFHYRFWKGLDTVTNATGSTSFLQLLVMLELMLSVGFFVYSILLAVLFFYRRDTFPMAMIYFMMARVIYLTLDKVVFHEVYQLANWGDTAPIILTVVVNVVITNYLKRSQQVKETFVVPYRAPY